MPNKAQEYVELADDTARKLAGDYRGWTDFLTTSARLYKYNYYDQLLIYAQRPDATACAEFDLWNNTMHRYIHKGAKGIALITPTNYGPRLRYVFDISDTGERHNSLSVNPWILREEHIQSVSDMLEDRFDALASLGIAAQLEQIAQRQALNYWREHRRDIIDSVADTFMQEYDDFSIGASFRKLAANSLQFTLESRCELEPEAEREDFVEVFNWNTPAALMELGTAVNTISGTVLRQIESTIKSYERSHENERADLHPERRLPVPEPDSDRSGQDRYPAGQVRTDAPELPEGEPTRPVQPAAPEREADAAPAGNREDRADEDGILDDEPEEAVQRDGGTESEGSDELGSADEQPAAPGGRDDPLGTDLQLTPEEQSARMRLSEQMSFIVPSESEQIELIDILEAESVQTPFAFSVPQEVVDEVLRQGGNTSDLRLIIANDFMKQMPITTIAERMQRLYHGGNGLIINGKQYSAWYEDAGIRIAYGKYARNVHMSQLLTWEDAAKKIDLLPGKKAYFSSDHHFGAPNEEDSLVREKKFVQCLDEIDEGTETTDEEGNIIDAGEEVEVIVINDRLIQCIGDQCKQYGIEITDVKIKTLDLPNENKEAVYQRMITERNNIAAAYKAQGESEAQIIRNTTDAEVSIMISEAQAEADAIVADGEAQYMSILSEAYNDEDKADFYLFSLQLDTLKESVMNGNTTIFLDADSPIAQIFEGAW